MCAQEFMICLLNLQMERAYTYCTPESRPWLRQRMSLFSEEDIKSMESNEVDCTVEANTYKGGSPDDSLAYVLCTAYNVMIADTLESEGTIRDKALFIVPMVKRDDRWRVKMEGPLRNER